MRALLCILLLIAFIGGLNFLLDSLQLTKGEMKAGIIILILWLGCMYYGRHGQRKSFKLLLFYLKFKKFEIDQLELYGSAMKDQGLNEAYFECDPKAYKKKQKEIYDDSVTLTHIIRTYNQYKKLL